MALDTHFGVSSALDEIEKEGVKSVKCRLQKLYSVWSDFGIEKSRMVERAGVVWNHIEHLLQEILDEETVYYRTVEERVKNFTDAVKELAVALSVPPREVNGSLVTREEKLRDELIFLNQLKQQRIKSLQLLREEESKYCEKMDWKTCSIPCSSGIPSEDDLVKMKERNAMLKEENKKRLNKWSFIRKEFLTLLRDTGMSAETQFEADIQSDSAEKISLSDETFKALNEVVSKFQQKKAELETRKLCLLNKLSALWDNLEMSEKIRSEFSSSHKGCHITILQSIEAEITKCMDLKIKKIKESVDWLWQELEQLWSKCHASEQEKKRFPFYCSSETSEKILDALKKEVEMWRQHYDNLKPLLLKIEQRRELWEKMLEFERKANDVTRYKNRRGSLLDEERERKMLLKDLPALENEIFQDIQEYESHADRPFLYCGEDYRVFVSNQWQQRMNRKEEERLRRLNHPCEGAKSPVYTSVVQSQFFTTCLRTPPSARKKLPTNTGSAQRDAFSPCNRRKPPPRAYENSNKGCLRRNSIFIPSSPEVRGPLKELDQQLLLNGTTYTEFEAKLRDGERQEFQSSVLDLSSRASQTFLADPNKKSSNPVHSQTSKTQQKENSSVTKNLSKTGFASPVSKKPFKGVHKGTPSKFKSILSMAYKTKYTSPLQLSSKKLVKQSSPKAVLGEPNKTKYPTSKTFLAHSDKTRKEIQPLQSLVNQHPESATPNKSQAGANKTKYASFKETPKLKSIPNVCNETRYASPMSQQTSKRVVRRDLSTNKTLVEESNETRFASLKETPTSKTSLAKSSETEYASIMLQQTPKRVVGRNQSAEKNSAADSNKTRFTSLKETPASKIMLAESNKTLYASPLLPQTPKRLPDGSLSATKMLPGESNKTRFGSPLCQQSPKRMTETPVRAKAGLPFLI